MGRLTDGGRSDKLIGHDALGSKRNRGLTCPNCRGLARNSFGSEGDFLAMEKTINVMVADSRLRPVKNAAPVDQPLFPQDHYECAACGTRWALSHPDQAYRGFLKPVGSR